MFQSYDESNTNEPVYSKVQRFYIKNSISDEKQKDLRITVDVNVTLSKVSKQLLNINITDDEDPYFYYSLVLTNEDYQHLKNLQGLLVDFDNFPAQVIRLLEQCKLNEANSSKFLLLLEEDFKSDLKRTYLKIVETNNFKHLCHLILQVEPGNDGDIKKLMLKKINILKERNIKVEKLIVDLENQLANMGRTLESTQNELVSVRQQWKEDRILAKAESSKEISEETEKLRRLQLDWQIKMQREKVEFEERYTISMKEKDGEISKLRMENQILLEKRTNFDITITDQARRIDSLEKELMGVRGELSSMRKLNTRLEGEFHEKDKIVAHYKTRIAVAEQEVKDKTDFANKLQELLNKINEQKTKLEDVVNEKEKHLQRKQATIQNISDELIKANEIITKLQKDLTLIGSKLSVRTSIALEQEKVVEENVRRISKMEEEIVLRDKKLTELIEEGKMLKLTINDQKELLETREKKIKDNERVIDWLNRRLSDQTKMLRDSPQQFPTIATSTPYGQFVGSTSTNNINNNEISTPRIPFSTMNTIGNAIQRIEQLENLPIIVEEEIKKKPDENQQPIITIDNSDDVSIKKSTLNVKNQIDKSTKSQKSTLKRNTGVGFRRVTTTQTTSVPSSYFLK